MPPSAESPDNITLSDVLESLELEGYRGQMAARPAGQVLCVSCHMESDAAEMQVDDLRRLEGVSDPADMMAVAALVCPVCKTQGTLVLSYGPEASGDDAEVLALLSDIPT
ncbi:MAG: hypothetical protein M3314_00700 [Actinomycetota bacterium]|nr:hypothetical protein [Actinomycetota bacterium]